MAVKKTETGRGGGEGVHSAKKIVHYSLTGH